MKKLALLVAIGLISISSFAQEKKEEAEKEGFVFTTVKANPITSVKNQNRAGTCWCYSSMGFLESELLRMGKGTYDFSEMYLAEKTYMDRAEAAVCMHGDVSFSQGGSFYDVIYGMDRFGLVPEEVMPPGVMYGDTLSDHTELSALTDAMVAAITKGKLRKLQTDPDGNALWKKAIEAVHETYLGKAPETFVYEGKTYTPRSFYQSLGLNANDYISLTSYTHHPFYQPFVIEVQDNWRWAKSYNLPIDELLEVFDYAIDNGYTIAWGADVSEQGFTRNGIAVVPDTKKIVELSGSDMAHWLKLPQQERNIMWTCSIATGFAWGIANSLAAQAAISRIIFSMSRDNLLPKGLNKVHPKFKTPYIATIFIAILSFALTLVFSSNIEYLSSLVNFGALTGFLVLHFAVIYHFFFKQKSGQVFKHLVLPLVGLIIIFYVWIHLHKQAFTLGVIWVAIGIVYYIVNVKIRKKNIDLGV